MNYKQKPEYVTYPSALDILSTVIVATISPPMTYCGKAI